MQYTTENTEGYSAYDLVHLNRIYEHRIALLDEDERENLDYLQHISEQVLSEYDVARKYEGAGLSSRGGSMASPSRRTAWAGSHSQIAASSRAHTRPLQRRSRPGGLLTFTGSCARSTTPTSRTRAMRATGIARCAWMFGLSERRG